MHTEPETVLAGSTSNNSASRHVLNGPTMGTRYAAVFFAPEGTDVAAIAPALQASVDVVDQQMSTWIADSDLMRFKWDEARRMDERSGGDAEG